MASTKKELEDQQNNNDNNNNNNNVDKEGYSGYYPNAKTFAELPLSNYTKQGLQKAGYIKLTDIQVSELII